LDIQSQEVEKKQAEGKHRKTQQPLEKDHPLVQSLVYGTR
jgi:hypothetical protein